MGKHFHRMFNFKYHLSLYIAYYKIISLKTEEWNMSSKKRKPALIAIAKKHGYEITQRGPFIELIHNGEVCYKRKVNTDGKKTTMTISEAYYYIYNREERSCIKKG